LGQLLRRTREAQGLSLRQAAGRIYHPNGQPISYTYLQAVEKDRRRPSLPLLFTLAAVYELDIAVLLLHAQKIPEFVHAYLRAVPAGAATLLRLLLTAYQIRFAAWELLQPQLLELARATAQGQGTPVSQESAAQRMNARSLPLDEERYRCALSSEKHG
jgi:transcriptional regulator with XRE-family HTH domain